MQNHENIVSSSFLKTPRNPEEKNFDPQNPEEQKNWFLTFPKPRGSKTGRELETQVDNTS